MIIPKLPLESRFKSITMQSRWYEPIFVKSIAIQSEYLLLNIDLRGTQFVVEHKSI